MRAPLQLAGDQRRPVDTTGLHDLADRLFDAFVAHELDVAEAMMAPDAVVVQNGNSMAWARPAS